MYLDLMGLKMGQILVLRSNQNYSTFIVFHKILKYYSSEGMEFLFVLWKNRVFLGSLLWNFIPAAPPLLRLITIPPVELHGTGNILKGDLNSMVLLFLSTETLEFLILLLKENIRTPK